MDITGKLVEILPAQSGSSARGGWKRQDFIIETQEQFPKKVCIENWNDKIDLGSFAMGTAVTVGINIESREFNGRWYTGVKGWRMAIAGNESDNSSSGNYPPPASSIPPPMEEEGSDDLPF